MVGVVVGDGGVMAGTVSCFWYDNFICVSQNTNIQFITTKWLLFLINN